MSDCKTLVVDAMNLAYKVFYRLPHLKNSKGKSSSTVFGFLNSLNALYKRYQPENLIVCWDSKNSIRRKIDPTYKVRKKQDNEEFTQFIFQIVKLKSRLPEIGIPSIELNGYESDDLMAFVANKKELRPTVICTTDNDLYQCLTEGVKIFNFKNEIDKKLLYLMFGLTPRLYTVYKAIKGCPTDTVTGLAGYGEVKTVEFIKECNYNIETIYKKLDQLKLGKQFDHTLSLVVLPLYMEYNLPIKITQLKIDRKELVNLFYEYNINSISVNDFLGGK